LRINPANRLKTVLNTTADFNPAATYQLTHPLAGLQSSQSKSEGISSGNRGASLRLAQQPQSHSHDGRPDNEADRGRPQQHQCPFEGTDEDENADIEPGYPDGQPQPRQPIREAAGQQCADDHEHPGSAVEGVGNQHSLTESLIHGRPGQLNRLVLQKGPVS